tara:strand:- start:8283 stop:8519 length:237 start_codon:yes stop_codon:yes gene_type:complete
MAARLNPRHQEMVRDKIQASQLINRLQKHVDGELELSVTQIRAIECLLDRSLPKLTATDITTDGQALPAYHFHAPDDG